MAIRAQTCSLAAKTGQKMPEDINFCPLSFITRAFAEFNGRLEALRGAGRECLLLVP